MITRALWTTFSISSGSIQEITRVGEPSMKKGGRLRHRQDPAYARAKRLASGT